MSEEKSVGVKLLTGLGIIVGLVFLLIFVAVVHMWFEQLWLTMAVLAAGVGLLLWAPQKTKQAAIGFLTLIAVLVAAIVIGPRKEARRVGSAPATALRSNSPTGNAEDGTKTAAPNPEKRTPMGSPIPDAPVEIEKRAVARCSAFQSAILRRDGSAAAGMLTPDSFLYWDEVREAGIQPEVEMANVTTLLQTLAHELVGTERLGTMTGRTLFIRAVQEGWALDDKVHGDWLRKIALAAPIQSEDELQGGTIYCWAFTDELENGLSDGFMPMIAVEFDEKHELVRFSDISCPDRPRHDVIAVRSNMEPRVYVQRIADHIASEVRRSR